MNRKIKVLSIISILFCLSFFVSTVVAGTTQYQYDDLHRLTRVERSDGMVTVYEYDGLGNRTRMLVTSNSNITALFTASPTIGVYPLTVEFTDQSIGDITSWSWDFGDDQTSTEQNPNHIYNAPGTYTVSLIVTGQGGSDTETKTDYILIENVEGFENGDLSQFPWITSGDGLWGVTNTNPYNGSCAAESPSVGDSESAALETTMYCQEGEITFWFSVSSEENVDHLYFYVDDVLEGAWSGSVAYTQANYPVSSGVHSFEWVYAKDESGSAGSDAAWLDDIYFPTTVMGAIIHVPGDQPTIQAGINAASDGDTILVADGTYTGYGNKNLDFNGKAITVRSENGPECCIIDCEKDGRGFYFHSEESESSVVDGFTIKNGYMHIGAGIYCNNSDPIIKNCMVIENTAEWLNGIGGGCYFSDSFSEITNCWIAFNSAIGTSEYSGNGWGGGIAIGQNSHLTIKNCHITNNFATYSSGGLGVHSSLSILNSIIANNSSHVSGGFGFQDSNSTITNCTIAENNGCGFYHIRSNIVVVNTILWGNSGGTFEDEVDGWGSSVNITYSDINGGYEGEGNIDADPLFVDAANGDFHLFSGSPCIDAGTNNATGLLDMDFDNDSRIIDGNNDTINTVDMGADEFSNLLMLENFETGDLSKFPWVTSGDGVWNVTSSNPYNDSYAAQSPSIGNSESATIETTLYCQEGEVSFWYSVSSEENWDYLYFYVDDVLEGAWSGSVDYTQTIYSVTSGVHSFEWVYAKDESVSAGSDAAWLDDISFPGTVGTDSDHDGLTDELENSMCTDPLDADTDDDGISDGYEHYNYGTDPCDVDTDGDGIQDGTEIGVTEPVADPDGSGPLLGTDIEVFIQDTDESTTTDPLNDDTDDDGLLDGEEDTNHNGMVDEGEDDPNISNPAGDLKIDSILMLTGDVSYTLPTGSNTVIYGNAGTNNISLESGATVNLFSFVDSNIITINASSSLFTVSRSGAAVTLEGSDGTLLSIPATTTAQIIAFSNGASELIIENGAVTLNGQKVTATPTSVATPSSNAPNYTGNSLLNFDQPDAYLILLESTVYTLPAFSCTMVYGDSDRNNLTLDSGAMAKLFSFVGNNNIAINAHSSLFTVSRSGATVTIEGIDGTILIIPATASIQMIIFNDISIELVIDNNQVMIGNQVIDQTPAVIGDLPVLSDYSTETGTITAVVDVTGTSTTQVVTVDQNGNGVLTDAGDRVDILENIELIVAASNSAGNDSILDFTGANQDVEITFQYGVAEDMITSRDLMENTVRIADGDSYSIDGVPTFVEYYDLDDDDDIAPFANATWNRVEGSDNAETVIYEGSEDLVDEAGLDHRYSNDVLTLRGGDNYVLYNNLETSISANINVVEDSGTGDGLITTTVSFQNGNGGVLAGAGTHTITSYTSDNSIAAGSLKLGASQDAEDTVWITSDSDKLFVLGTSPSVLDLQVGDLDTLRLTGFEFIGDADTDDVYQFESLTTGIDIADNPVNDRDTIQVGDDAVDYEAAPADTISLKVLNDEFNFDFDVLDVTNVTENNLILVGDTDFTRDLADDLIVGNLDFIDDTQNFTNSLWLTNASVESNGNIYVLDVDSSELQDGSKDKFFNFSGNSLNLSLVTNSDVEIIAVDTTAVGVILVGGTGNDLICGDTGNDLIYGGLGVDNIIGGAGHDIIVVIGELATGDYVAANLAGTGANFLDLNNVIINTKSVSDVTTDSYDGGGGMDIIEIWGAVELSNATISNIENCIIHSDVTMKIEDAAGMNFLIADADSHLTLVNEAGITVAELDSKSTEADYLAIGIGYANAATWGQAKATR